MAQSNPRWKVTFGPTFIDADVEFWTGTQWVSVGRNVVKMSLGVELDRSTRLNMDWSMLKKEGTEALQLMNSDLFRSQHVLVEGHRRLEFNHGDGNWEVLDAIFESHKVQGTDFHETGLLCTGRVSVEYSDVLVVLSHAR